MPPAALRLILAAFLGAAVPAGAEVPGFDPPRPIASPVAAGSAEPHLATAPDGAVWLSWLEKRRGSRHVFRAARLDGTRWSRPITIAEGDSFFVNWADFPTLLPLGGGRLVAHWPWKSGLGNYTYEVRIARSEDGGRTWSPPVVPHSDGTPTEHGFVSLVAEGDDARAVWLDGRGFAARPDSAASASSGHDPHAPGEMTLRTALLPRDGGTSGESLIDPRVCDCCQTAAAATASGPIVAYRDRSESEMRDISIVRLIGGRWTDPVPVHQDGWQIAGCPVNGPAIDAAGARVAVAWFTAARDTAGVSVAFSDDSGVRFGPRVRLDGGDPVGRVDVTLLQDGSAVVLWVESEAGGRTARIETRHVTPAGAVAAPVTVARTSAARASGFPRMVRSGDRLIFAWTDAGKPSRVRVAVGRIREGQSPGLPGPK